MEIRANAIRVYLECFIDGDRLTVRKQLNTINADIEEYQHKIDYIKDQLKTKSFGRYHGQVYYRDDLFQDERELKQTIRLRDLIKDKKMPIQEILSTMTYDQVKEWKSVFNWYSGTFMVRDYVMQEEQTEDPVQEETKKGGSRDFMYVEINKYYTATVRCIESFKDYLNDPTSVIDDRFGNITCISEGCSEDFCLAVKKLISDRISKRCDRNVKEAKKVIRQILSLDNKMMEKRERQEYHMYVKYNRYQYDRLEQTITKIDSECNRLWERLDDLRSDVSRDNIEREQEIKDYYAMLTLIDIDC